MSTLAAMTTPAGWYPDGASTGVERWWDGTQWTENRRATPNAVPAYARPPEMVTLAPKRTSHVFHLIMTILTAGVWGLFVWLPLTLLHKFQHEKSVTRVR